MMIKTIKNPIMAYTYAFKRCNTKKAHRSD